MKNNKISQTEKELVIARLETYPTNIGTLIGSDNKPYSKKDLIDNVAQGTAVGKQIVDIELSYLKDLATGKIYDIAL